MFLAAAQSTAQQVYPGLAGFLVVAGMGVAVYFLFRSLNKQLRKISPAGPPPKPGKPRRGLAAYRAQQAATAGPPAARPASGDGSEPAAGGDSGPA